MVTIGHMVSQLVDLLNDFASDEFQHRCWVRAEDPGVVASFTESVEALDSFSLDSVASWMLERGMISAHDHGRAQAFSRRIWEFWRSLESKGLGNAPDKVIISLPDWPGITKHAAEVAAILRPFSGSTAILDL